MRPSTVLAGSALLSGGIAGFALLAPSALPRMQAQRDEAARLSQDVEALRQKTEELELRARRLRGQGPGAELMIEGVIREELGYIRADEHLLIFDRPAASAAATPAAATPPAATPPAATAPADGSSPAAEHESAPPLSPESR